MDFRLVALKDPDPTFFFPDPHHKVPEDRDHFCLSRAVSDINRHLTIIIHQFAVLPFLLVFPADHKRNEIYMIKLHFLRPVKQNISFCRFCEKKLLETKAESKYFRQMKSRHLVPHRAAQKIMADRRVQSDPAPARKPPAHDLLISECCDPIVQHPVIFRMKDPFRLTVDLPEGFKSLRQRIPKTRRYISECQESPEGHAIQHFIISSFPADEDRKSVV